MTSPKSSRFGVFTAKKFEYEATFIVRVGTLSSQKDFVVHEGIICPRSEFFCRTMNGNWSTAKDRVVILEDADPDIFAIYLNLVYTNRLPTMECSSDGNTILLMTKAQIQEEYTRLSKLYILSERFLDREAKNTIIAALLELSKERSNAGWVCAPPEVAINLVYEETHGGSPIQRLFVDIYSTVPDDKLETAKSSEPLPKDFWCDVAIALRKRIGDRVGFRETVDAYLENTQEKG
ncbi:hypothetical protein K491DRAFT_720471 [Lophiostoma macrostomum CBS 122681]|uniref:BTB domain-containing protein n=1 Tax=Lophiostoma macrostomum CBS 122681 TaxID=1314788 RepID=A0A6A6SX36_9PLEO|nr:hypothetical protein K491DRAFT_720471 [Lophiostoma macrostomum CBS 122681]